jgi:L-seryl-tRNA(Ser) seleniumtransferase
MPPEVLEAMNAAAGWFVDLPELHRRAGKRLAELINSPAIEDAAIVSGAAAGLTIATAACLTGTDRAKIRALPHLDWPDAPTEVVIQQSHVTGFAQSFRGAGPRLTVIGGAEGATPEEFTTAIGRQTAAVAFLGGGLPGNARFSTRTPLAQVVEIAHARGVPVIVDAAAELPPPEHLRRFSELGADLVVFSGGKGLRGPQASGLVLGKGELIEACRLNNSPNGSIGRPMKVGKEEICGLLAAVELYVARDHDADQRRWSADVGAVLDGLAGLDGVQGKRIVARTIPQAELTFDGPARLTAADVAARLAEGDPSIRANVSGAALVINPHNLQDGEADVIARRLREVITAAALQPVLA